MKKEKSQVVEDSTDELSPQRITVATSVGETLNIKAKKKLSKQEKKFVRNKVHEYQEYVKIKPKLGFSKRELQKINCDAIIDKCIQLDCDEQKYNKWFENLKSQDVFISEHNPVNQIRKQYSGNSHLPVGDWSIKITDGEKHSHRIKKLNAVKRNEAFDEKYEESREEREERQAIADRKRIMIQQL